MGGTSSHTLLLLVIMLCHRASGGPCWATRYPALCAQALAISSLGSSNSNTPNVVHTLYDLINVTLSRTNLPLITSKYVLDMLTSRFVPPQANVMRHCQTLVRMSGESLKKSLKALRKQSLGEVDKEDIQTWLSATITYQQACKDAVGAHVATNAYLARLHRRMEHLSMLTSNPLALVNRLKLVGGSFPERKVLDRSGTGWKPDVVVAKDGSGDVTTVGEAIGMASGAERFLIYVKAGTYVERIQTNKGLITLVGDGMETTIITWNGSFVFGSKATLSDTATLVITGYGFMAQDISIVNSAGPRTAQAVALAVASDHSVFHRCSIEGYQDTLYALSNRQFYRDCHIHGTIDFIFGNAAAVFQNCTIILRLPIPGAFNVILANSRTNIDQNTGFILHNCTIAAGPDLSHDEGPRKSYLGRPWREYSRAVVMQSRISEVISVEGWVMWPGASYYNTLYFAEYGNTGFGNGTLQRVKWPGCHVLGTTDEAMQFTVGNFIGGESWLNSTGVNYISGLQ